MVYKRSSDGSSWLSSDDFVMAEDEALKSYLQGITVSDDKNSGRAVPVWFAMPDMEVRDQKFPFIIVELVGMVEDKAREMRGLYKVGNDPVSYERYADRHYRWAESALPFNLIYQATAYARHPRHQRQIIQQMLGKKLSGRLRGLPVATDETKRTMELTSWTSRDTIENGRKLWQTVYTISIATEISDIFTDQQSPPVLTVDIDTEDVSNEPLP